MRTRSNPLRMLDQLPPEVLGLVLSQLLPQDMMVQKCSRRWRDADLDVSYWKQLFLNTFALDQRDATPTTKRGRKAAKARSRVWRDRYERAWRFRLEPGKCALGLQLERPLSAYEPRSFGPDVIPAYHQNGLLDAGVLTVRDIKGKNKKLSYYVHSEGVDWGPEDVDVDIWLEHREDEDEDEDYYLHEGILDGCVVNVSSSAVALYDPTRPAVGRRGIRVGSPLRHLLEAFGLSLDDVISACDSRRGSRFRLRGVDNFDFGLGRRNGESAEDQWEPIPNYPELLATREDKLNWPLQTIHIWSGR